LTIILTCIFYTALRTSFHSKDCQAVTKQPKLVCHIEITALGWVGLSIRCYSNCLP